MFYFKIVAGLGGDALYSLATAASAPRWQAQFSEVVLS